VLIHDGCRLGTAVASKAVEIVGGDVMLAENAFEANSTTERFGCIVAHILHCSPAAGHGFGAMDAGPSIG
jgi:hypothetical protein